MEGLSGRREEYNVLISAEVKSDCISVTLDLEITSPEPLTLELESLLDQVVDNALETLEHELLSRYGKTQGTGPRTG